MKKSVLTSLIAASALFTGVAFAGGYTADAGYTAADTSAMAGSQSGLFDGLYVGAGVNHSAQNESKTSVNGVTAGQLDTSNYGWSVLVGKNLTELFAIELAYNSFGKNTFTDSTGATVNDYYQIWDTSVMGVFNSPSFSGFSAHAKAGAAYLSEKGKTGSTKLATSSATTLAYGLGVQYAFDQFALSFDWTRFENNNNQSTQTGNMYVPDQFGLNLIYTFA